MTITVNQVSDGNLKARVVAFADIILLPVFIGASTEIWTNLRFFGAIILTYESREPMAAELFLFYIFDNTNEVAASFLNLMNSC